MSIRRITVEGKPRYFVHRPRRSSGYEDIGLCTLNGKTFIVAYLPYSGHYYAFDQETGNEIANFSKEFYEENIAHGVKTKLVVDENCLKSK